MKYLFIFLFKLFFITMSSFLVLHIIDNEIDNRFKLYKDNVSIPYILIIFS
jgi:hypothetical protein